MQYNMYDIIVNCIVSYMFGYKTQIDQQH